MMEVTRKEFVALSARVAALEAKMLKPSQRGLLHELLPAIFLAIGDKSFSVASLREYAAVTQNPMLDDVPDPSELGRLLAAADGIPVNGYAAHKIGGNQAHRLWMVKPA
jgi:hypothetical protein